MTTQVNSICIVSSFNMAESTVPVKGKINKKFDRKNKIKYILTDDDIE